MSYVAGPGQPRSLSDNQIREIKRLRQMGKEYKEISTKVGCSVAQVIHYWRSSPFYRGKWKKNKQGPGYAATKASIEKHLADELAKAKRVLKQEIDQAKRESCVASPYKSGPLAW